MWVRRVAGLCFNSGLLSQAAWSKTFGGKSKFHTLLCDLENYSPVSEPQLPYLKNDDLLCRLWLKPLTWYLPCCVTLGKKLFFSEPQFLHLQSWVDKYAPLGVEEV